MKKGRGNIKGGAYERLICEKLSLWASEGKRTDIFWRSSMSGGRATVQRKKGIDNKTQCCDISAIDPLGNFLTDKFVVECKHYKDLKLENLIYDTTKDGIIQFWNETSLIAIKSNKNPILIARQNGKKDIICVTEELYKLFDKANFSQRPIVYYFKIGMYICLLDIFLKEVSYNIIKSLSIKNDIL